MIFLLLLESSAAEGGLKKISARGDRLPRSDLCCGALSVRLVEVGMSPYLAILLSLWDNSRPLGVPAIAEAFSFPLCFLLFRCPELPERYVLLPFVVWWETSARLNLFHVLRLPELAICKGGSAPHLMLHPGPLRGQAPLREGDTPWCSRGMGARIPIFRVPRQDDVAESGPCADHQRFGREYQGRDHAGQAQEPP